VGKYKSLTHANDILNQFSVKTPELGVKDISRKLGISLSNTSRLIKTMDDLGIIRKNIKTRKYLLGSKFLNLTRVYLSSIDLKTIARPYMVDLNERTNELITLVILRNERCDLVDWVESKRSIRQVIGDEKSLHPPIYAVAPGKLLLSFLPDREIDRILAKTEFVEFTDRTVMDKNELKKQVIGIRGKGLAISCGEYFDHTFAVSAPIYDWSEKAIAAITISWTKLDDKPENANEYSGAVKEAAIGISNDMGFQFIDKLLPAVK
jgi:IclR family transcriptional regulator, KDG regulon repressor